MDALAHAALGGHDQVDEVVQQRSRPVRSTGSPIADRQPEVRPIAEPDGREGMAPHQGVQLLLSAAWIIPVPGMQVSDVLGVEIGQIRVDTGLDRVTPVSFRVS
jgi:hypothetical protein